MSKYYNARRRSNLYQKDSLFPFRLSRSKIDLFLNCPKCFYLDRKLGVTQPPSFPFSLNSAVDKLLKKEFDIHRAKGNPHPLMKSYGIDAVPYSNDKIDLWRDPFKGISYHHSDTNFIVFGGIDDVWVNPYGELHIVDYKSTAKEGEVNLDSEWQIAYKRQMETYQWLFARNDFKVSKTGYFVYANCALDREAFDGKLEFRVKIIPYEGNFDWVEDVLVAAKNCLDSDKMPEENPECDFCMYRKAVIEAER